MSTQHLQSQAYEMYRPLLMNLAYHMLGSVSDAEDIVQDVFMNYFQLDRSTITHEKAYLARMVTNRSLNFLSSARKRRETYIGSWLPEPSVAYRGARTGRGPEASRGNAGIGRNAAALEVHSRYGQDPAEAWESFESVTYAMLVVLEQLTGVERAVFLLRESLAFEYSDIAEAVGKSAVSCRKILSRAKAKLGAAPAIPTFRSSKADELAQAFILAAQNGDIDHLISLLTEDAVLVSDGGGKVRAAIFPIVGRDRIIAFFVGISRKGSLGVHYVPADVSGQSGLLLLQDGKPKKVMTFQWDMQGERVEKLFFILNPDKLKHVYVTNESCDLS